MTSRPKKAKRVGGKRQTDSRAFDAAVGARIQTKRKKVGLSQDAVAEALGCSPGQVSRYESGDTTVEPETLAKLGVVFGCTPGEFIDGIKVDAA